MILVDTSVWVDHFRQGNSKLVELLGEASVYSHPWVIGELACGNLSRRDETLDLLRSIPSVRTASDDEVLHLLNSQKLWGRGLGWIDLHLIASLLLSGLRFWTLDKRLARTATDLGIPTP